MSSSTLQDNLLSMNNSPWPCLSQDTLPFCTVNSELKEVMLKYLKELMADATTYGWEPIHAYHVVWLQQIENGSAEWDDTDVKLEFHRDLVWNTVKSQASDPYCSPPAGCEGHGKQACHNHGKPGTKICTLLNQGKCTAQSQHPPDKHICSYCLNVAKKVCSLPMQNLQ